MTSPLPSASTDETRAALDALREAASTQLAALHLKISKLNRAHQAMDLVDSAKAVDAFDCFTLRALPPLTQKNIAAELKRDAKRAKK